MSAIKMRCVDLILVYLIGVVACRPQNIENIEARTVTAAPGVEIERQHIEHVTPVDESTRFLPENFQQPQRKIEANTRDILEKIAQVNVQQGLKPKKQKPNYFHFPYSFSRSQDDHKLHNFKIFRDPFTNPILDYLEKDNSKSEKNRAIFHKTANYNEPDDVNAEILPEHQENQFIKRKVIHYQSVMMPSPYIMNMYNMRPASSQFTLSQSMMPMKIQDLPFGTSTNNMPTIVSKPPQGVEGSAMNIHKDSVQNGLVHRSPSYTPSYYPHINTHNGQLQNMNLMQTFPMYPVMLSDSSSKARQNWNWPGANLFPIYIRDPFLQMYYAFTNMVEYGPNSGNEGPCKLTPRPQGSRIKVNSKTSHIVDDKGQQLTLKINKAEGSKDITVTDVAADGLNYLDLDDIDIGDDDLVKFTVNLPKSKLGTEARGIGDKTEKMRWEDFMRIRNNSQLSNLATGQLDFRPPNIPENQHSAIIKDPILTTEELEDDVESEKAEEVNVANENSRRVFSSDNTGSGIFIRKLKVRKGGVAIAGPGGIATAGSGGTAIVGPNGIAYTHPHGLAIAGSGSKVLAVDPAIDLNDVVKDTVLNGTQHIPNTRLAKVVAVGPVVYYNEG